MSKSRASKPQPLDLLHKLAEAQMAFYILPALMALLIAGTLAQRWLGLFAAHKMFFSTFILWAGPIPLPGGYTLLTALSLSLLLKFLLKSPWSLPKSGIILTHFGVLILLIGGLLTSIFARETYMIIREGDESAYSYHYTDKSLDIYENDTLLTQLDFAARAAWSDADLPFKIIVENACDNCKIIQAEQPIESAHGMARSVRLQPLRPEKDPEANFSGARISIQNTQSDSDGSYLIFDAMPQPINFEKNGRRYSLIFGKRQFTLPFSLKLVNFEKQTYGGTDTARSFSSDLILTDGALSWPVYIEMNKPYRYRGYTFFQSSFIQDADNEATILSVVENKGRLFPYLGTLITGLGLLLHIFLRKKRTGRQA